MDEKKELAKRLGLPMDKPPKSEENKARFKRFLDEEWGIEAAIATVFRAWNFQPVPPPFRWDIPSNLNVEQLTWEQVHTDKFIDEIWPVVEMLLGDDVLNWDWAARVATVLSLFNVIRIIPIVMESLADAKRNS